MAEQAQVIGVLAPGRFRLGVGPSHKESTERTFGVDFHAPLGHLKEYLRIVKGLNQKGTVDFDGQYYAAHCTISSPIDVPVMASALRPGAFELCGSEADGAISWVCPHAYLRSVALPALRRGAEKVGRPPPPLIVHALVCVDEDVDAVHEVVRESLGYFPSSTFYAKMFATAGSPVSADGGWTHEMMDSVVIAGDELAVTARLEALFGWGASEVVATIVTVGDAPDESRARTMRALAQFARSPR
jgi:alkanesulfonate monooxygenase SsuD/methylene tetrahydromethanopterin reductase-like flavin-dependent oxidoreductase (luciferase family)